MRIITGTDPVFDLLNVDKECHAQCLPCIFEDRITASEVAVLRAVMQKPMWEEAASGLASAISAALPSVFGGLLGGGGSSTNPPPSTKLQGYELTKMIVEEIKKAQRHEDELTKKEVRDAVMAAVSAYSTGALQVMLDLIQEEYKTVGIANVEVRTGGAPENEEIVR